MKLQDTMVTRNLSPVMNGDEKGTFIQFFHGAVYNAFKSAEAGTDKFDEKEFVKIMFAGNNQTVVEKVVDVDLAARFERQLALWKTNSEQVLNGTPLESLPFLNTAIISELRRMNVFTAEALEELSDTSVQTLGMGAQTWKNKTIEWMKANKDKSETPRLIKENQDLRTDVDALKQQVATLSSLLQEKTGAVPPTEATPKKNARQ